MTGIVLWIVGILSFSLSLRKLFSCILHLLLLHLHSYQFRVFGTGSETSGPIPRNIFIFNWTIDVKECNFRLRTWGNAKALARFHPKFYDENFKISSLSFKHIYLENVKHVRESHKNPSTGFCSCSVIGIQLICNISSSFSKVTEFYDLWFLLTIIDRFLI